jgi:hypothetical protein
LVRFPSAVLVQGGRDLSSVHEGVDLGGEVKHVIAAAWKTRGADLRSYLKGKEATE